MKNQRPRNLNLFTIRFPMPAIVSILHRITGVILFLATPLVIWALDLSLSNQENFQTLQEKFSSPLVKIIAWLIIAPFLYHFVAGIRHLFMDLNIGVELKSGRFTALLTFIISFILIVLAGVYLW